ncbi:MAG TPA: ATP-binding protein [Acidobacteriaceae bacterium]
MGTGLMPNLVRVFDWGSTPLGPLEQWSDTLVSNVNQVLFSPIPAILSWGPEFTFFYNEAAIPALQGKHPEALGASYREVYKEVWHLVGQDLEDCYYRGVTVVRENMLIPLLKNGQVEDGYFTYYLIPIFENGKIAGIYDPYQNTTDAVLTRRERDAVAAQLGQFLGVTSDAVVAVNRDWSITYLNSQGLKTYSSGRAILGKNLWEQFPDAVYEGSPYVEHYNRAMNEGLPGSFEAHYPEPLNIWIQIEVYPTEEGIVTFSRDISNRRKAEAALLLSEKLAVVGRLASSIAHEINNPLEAVTNLIYLARRSNELPEIHGLLDDADSELRRVSVIANQTLRFRKQSSEPVDITCEVLCSSVLAIFEGKIRNAQLSVEKRYRTHKPVKIFEGDIRQVLSNLIGNAVDAMSAGGRLLVRCREATSWRTGQNGWMLTVADTGCGMPPEVLSRVFEPFYTTKGLVGTGLGLWVSKDIVSRHKGTLKIRSSQNEAHRGTVAELFLPFEATKS